MLFIFPGCEKDEDEEIPHLGWVDDMEGNILVARYDKTGPTYNVVGYPVHYSELMVISKDGTEELLFPESDKIRWGMDLSPDGSKLAYIIEKTIYIALVDSTKVELINNLVIDHIYSLSWSPDGSAIAFLGRGSSYMIGVYDFITGECQYFEIGSEGSFYSSNIDWSPKGNQIAYAHEKSIWVLDITNGEKKKLIQNNIIGYYFDWYPDGNKLYFNDFQSNDDGQWDIIYHVNEDGSGVTEFLDFDKYGLHGYIWEITFSPDWQYIAAAGPSGIFIINMQGQIISHIQQSENIVCTDVCWR